MKTKIILGTAQLGLDYGINNKLGIPSDKECYNILDFAYQNDIRTLDTAFSYGLSEKRIGDFHYNNSLFTVNSKFRNGKIENLKDDILKSINKMNIKMINTIFFHSMNDFLINLNRIDKFIVENKNIAFKKLGVSVYAVEELEKVLEYTQIDVVQISFNLFDNHNKKGKILQSLASAGKEIHARSCFLQGLFFMDYNKLKYPLNKLASNLKNINNYCNEYKINIAQLCISYVINKKYIDKLIIGVDSIDQLRKNISWSIDEIDDDLENFIDRINIDENYLLNPSTW